MPFSSRNQHHRDGILLRREKPKASGWNSSWNLPCTKSMNCVSEITNYLRAMKQSAFYPFCPHPHFIPFVQPRSKGFRMRTRRGTRKPWSGPVNFAFWLANTILSKNNWTWHLTILTIQHLYFYDSCVNENVLQNNISKKDVFLTAWFTLHDLQNSKAVSTWAVMFPDKTRNVYYYLSCSFPCTVFILNVVQMSDEILRVLHCSNILIYNILYWQIKARQTIKWNY
jgi:hypothetical protein